MKIEIQNIDSTVDIRTLILKMDEAFKKAGIGSVQCTYYQVPEASDTAKEQERRKTKARPTELSGGRSKVEVDAFLDALCEVVRERCKPPAPDPDYFEQTIRGFIQNLDKPQPYTQHKEYFAGMKNAYYYALAIYQRTI